MNTPDSNLDQWFRAAMRAAAGLETRRRVRGGVRFATVEGGRLVALATKPTTTPGGGGGGGPGVPPGPPSPPGPQASPPGWPGVGPGRPGVRTPTPRPTPPTIDSERVPSELPVFTFTTPRPGGVKWRPVYDIKKPPSLPPNKRGEQLPEQASTFPVLVGYSNGFGFVPISAGGSVVPW